MQATEYIGWRAIPSHAMVDITSDLIGKRVETHEGEEVGEISSVENGKAILTAPTGVWAGLQEYVTSDDAAQGDEDTRLALDEDRIESVSGESVRLRGE